MKTTSVVVCAIASAVLLAFQVKSCHAQFQQTVQLPTFNVTGVSTNVVVPDRGGAYLGGVNRSNIGSRQYGTPLLGGGNRALGRATGAGGMSIHATIIDHDDIDRALLAEAARRRGAKLDIHGRAVSIAPRIRHDVAGRRWASGFERYGPRRSAAPLPY